MLIKSFFMPILSLFSFAIYTMESQISSEETKINIFANLPQNETAEILYTQIIKTYPFINDGDIAKIIKPILIRKIEEQKDRLKTENEDLATNSKNFNIHGLLNDAFKEVLAEHANEKTKQKKFLLQFKIATLFNVSLAIAQVILAIVALTQ